LDSNEATAMMVHNKAMYTGECTDENASDASGDRDASHTFDGNASESDEELSELLLGGKKCVVGREREWKPSKLTILWMINASHT